jgi:23S rRNA (cytosine1962-C5)-methyltransferase
VPTLRFRLPGRTGLLRAWLASLLPAVDRATRGRWIEAGRVRVDGQRFDRAAGACPPGARVEIDDVPEPLVPRLPEGEHAGWTALIDEPAWSGGALQVSASLALEFRIEARRQGLARIALEGPPCDAASLAAALAREALPIVGDLERGGLGVAGGARLVALDPAAGLAEPRGEPILDWPDEPAWIEDEGEGPPVFRVSAETARALGRGHPWILADEASDPADRHRRGALVQVETRGGDLLGWARIEGEGRLAARLWSRPEAGDARRPSIESRVARALARRRSLIEASLDVSAQNATHAFRLIHGEGDALPGMVVDRLGSLWRVLVTGRASDDLRGPVIEALRAQLPLTPEGEPWNVLELLHLRAAGPSRFDRVRWLAGGPEALVSPLRGEGDGEPVEDGFQVIERGLRFHVDPGWATPRQVRPGFGLFLDQRENRERLAPHAARGGRWLNLFAHTGAFSVSLLAAGAEHVTSVDLSAAWLNRLEANLAANLDRGVDPARHRSHRGEGRRYLETLPEGTRFAGIVLDPPTAAAAGSRFWSLARDLEPLVRRCVALLEPGGVLLVTQNRSGPPIGVDQTLERAASRAGRPIRFLDPAPAGPDHPSLDGFPEGDAFEGWLLGLD